MPRDGKDIHPAIPASEWADKGGNRPNWCPDGDRVMMNLAIERKEWRFVQARYDGTQPRTMTEVAATHGHPSLHPGGRFIPTDAYPVEKAAYGDGTAPLPPIDLKKSEKRTLVRIDAVTRSFRAKGGRMSAGAMRVDLHPAWDTRTYTQVSFNGVSDGTRHVFVADLRGQLT